MVGTLSRLIRLDMTLITGSTPFCRGPQSFGWGNPNATSGASPGVVDCGDALKVDLTRCAVECECAAAFGGAKSRRDWR